MNHPDFLEQMEKSYQDAQADKVTDINDYIISLDEEDE
jgi:hypothetical protein